MALPCLIAYALSYWMQGAARNMSMRWVFSTFIFVGMTLAYMLAASLSFVSVTLSELSSASNAMRSEVNYLCIHLAESDARTANLYDEVLDGYTMEQSGTVMVLVDNRVAGTDDERITQGVDVGKLFDPGVVEAIQQSVRTGTMQRFMTVWAATLNWQNGLLTYVNAGHNYPLLRHGHNGTWEWLKGTGDRLLGWFNLKEFTERTLVLLPGDELVLYTDGVNEAFNVDGEQYGNERLEAFLAQHANERPRTLVDALRDSVAAWSEGTEQSDGITILVMEYRAQD